MSCLLRSICVSPLILLLLFSIHGTVRADTVLVPRGRLRPQQVWCELVLAASLGTLRAAVCPSSLSRAASEPRECPERTESCIRGPRPSPLAEALPMSHPSGDESQNLRLSALSSCPRDNGFRVLGSLFYRHFQLPPNSPGAPSPAKT